MYHNWNIVNTLLLLLFGIVLGRLGMGNNDHTINVYSESLNENLFHSKYIQVIEDFMNLMW